MRKCLALVLVSALYFYVSISLAADWPQWQGQARNNISTEQNLLQSWESFKPKLLWTYRDTGAGYSGPAVVGNRAFIMGVQNGAEAMIALDIESGKQVWAAPLGKLFGNNWGDGPRGTPTVDGGMVYGISGSGDLVCLNAANGKENWKVSLAKDLEGKVMKIWGFTESPLIDGDKVVCSPGGPKGTLAALDKKTGKVLWRSTEITDEASYASMVKGKIGEQEIYIQMSAAGLIGVDPATGKKLFAEKVGVNGIAIIPTPVVSGNKVYVTSDYGTGCALVELTSSSGRLASKVLYEKKVMQNHHGGVVLLDGMIYGCTGNSNGRAKWICQNLETGDAVWESDNFTQSGSITFAGNRLYCYGQNDGTVTLVEPNQKAWTEKGRLTLPEMTKLPRKSGKIWTHPVVSNGKLFLRDLDLVFCFDVSAK